MMLFRSLSSVAILGLAISIVTPSGLGQTATALVREGDMVPGGDPALTIESISNTAVNHAGGYGVSLNAGDGVNTLSHVWGSAMGGSGAPLLIEDSYGSLDQTSFESFFGLGNGGDVAYSPSCDNSLSGSTGLDSAWVDGTWYALEEEPVASLPGQFWRFASRPGITAGGEPYWVGGITSISGGGTENRGLFFGVSGTPLLLGGQAVPGLPFVLDVASTVSFDYRFSRDGTHYISEVQMASGSSTDNNAMVVSGSGLLIGGSLVREGAPVPAGAGGLVGENWDNFDFGGINEAGDTFFTGDTDAATSEDEIVVWNGSVLYREGDVLDGATLNGSIEGAYANEDGDLALIWDIDFGGSNIEVLYVNGNRVLQEGDAVDFDGDGVVESNAILTDFTGISSLSLSDRDGDGNLSLYFTADVNVNGTTLEGAFRLVVPEVNLRAEPAQVNAGDTLTLTTYKGTPGDTAYLTVQLVNGVPFFSLVTSGTFDSDGNWVLSSVIPSGLSGIELGLISIALGSGGTFEASPFEMVQFL